MAKTTRIPISCISLAGDGYHIFISIKVNKIPANVLIDTGASKTVFDQERISKFIDHNDFELNETLSTGLGSSTIESRLTFLKKVKIGDFTIKKFPIAVMDLSHVNLSYEKIGLPGIDGVIGSDLLHGFNAIIDYRKAFLKLRG
jgi:predicted aspartyl protease